MEHELRARLREEPLRVVPAREVELRAPRDDHLVAARAEPLDEEGAEEAGAAGDEGAHLGQEPAVRPAGLRLIQSTRPIQLSRWSANQAIVRRRPSSQETFGFQPVSDWSFS